MKIIAIFPEETTFNGFPHDIESSVISQTPIDSGLNEDVFEKTVPTSWVKYEVKNDLAKNYLLGIGVKVIS